MNINRFIDHTLLKPFASHEQLKALCDEAKQYEFASVCVNPCHAAFAAKELAGTNVKTCCVVGFPFGTHLPEIKLAEAKAALRDGAQELDMVISVGHLLEGDEAYVEHEVQLLADACHEAGALLKVIIETCYLEETHIAAMCRIVEKTGADFCRRHRQPLFYDRYGSRSPRGGNEMRRLAQGHAGGRRLQRRSEKRRLRRPL